MFVLTNTAGASATTPAASKTTLFVDASGVPSTKSSAGTVTPLLTGPAAAAAYQPLDADLAGIAGLTYAADKSIYYTGSAWATYDLTGVGRTLLAATTQAAQRTALGLGDAAVQNIGTSGGNVPLLNGVNTWEALNTFTSTLTQSGSAGSVAFGPIGGTSPGLVFRRINAGSTYRSEFRSGIGSIQLGANAAAGDVSPTVFMNFAPAAMNPSNDNAMSGGTAANRFSQFFAGNSTIGTSDARLKTEPRPQSVAERKAGSALAREPMIWEWLTGDRLHAGPTVQAAMAVMEAHGLDPFAYSFICYDEWEAEPEQWHEWPAKDAVLDDEGNELEPAVEAGRELIQPAREAGDRYSFRKEELLCFMVAALAAENDVQVAKVEALDARLAALEAKA